MKSIFSFLILCLLAQGSLSQNIQNAGFDSVYIGAIDRIFHWITSDVWALNTWNDTVQPLTANEHHISPGLMYHEMLYTVHTTYYNDTSGMGNLAIKLFSLPEMVKPDGQPFPGFIVYGNHFYTDSTGFIDLKRGGEPFPYRPSHLNGYYLMEDSLSPIDNFGRVSMLLKSYDSLNQKIDTIGYIDSQVDLNPTSGSWLPFQIPVTYLSTQTPDSIVLAFYATTQGGQPASLSLDNISFEFSSNSLQPAIQPPFQVFPNPGWDQIQIKGPLHLLKKAEIVNSMGQLVLESEENKLDIRGLSAGTYLLRLTMKDNRIYYHKIICR